uniref:Fibronectin type-III domain-containing protein n=1 Tax=Sinocyclocheilus rhinocerous TaxID=307959 RepID=A0A673I765_9TELE
MCFDPNAIRCVNTCVCLAGFADLRCPDNVSVDSLNTRYVLRWDWPHETAVNQTVTFTAQYLMNVCQMPYWQIFLYFLISLLLSFLLVLLLSFCFYKTFTLLKNTFCPAIQLPDHIQELWLSDSEKPQLLAPESPETVCEMLVMVSAELDAVAVDEHSNAEEQDSSTHGRHGSGDSGVYSTEEDSCHRSDLQMSSRKHREELHDGTLLEL